MIYVLRSMMQADDPFMLHPRLAADTLAVGRLTLCHVLLMNDARYPWLVLVPGLPHLRDLHDLKVPGRTQLMEEIAEASRTLTELFRPDKVNVGAIGNIVPQLHVHVVARYTQDAAWPAPVWGVGEAQRYLDSAADHLLARLRRALPGLFQNGATSR